MTKLNSNNLVGIVALGAALACVGPAAAQTGAGSVSGKLVTESGQPLPAVKAGYRRAVLVVADSQHHNHPAPGEAVVSGSVTTGADRTFTIPSLPSGSYSLCLDNPPDLYVDHCAWNLSGAIFTVVAGANTALKPVTIIAGVRIHFLITDPQGLLPTAGPAEPAAHVGVRSSQGAYRPAAVASRSGAVTELVVTVPHNQPVSSWLFSRTVKFNDSTGKPVIAAAVTPPQGATDYNVSLTAGK